ncbi:MAG TPA: YfhO family protein, partial [Bacteroidota bacterium]
LALAIAGFVRNRKNPFVQYLGLMIFLSLLISFGKEFPLLYDPMFKYFPMFNKFRGPSMILTVVQILIPVLAAYGIASFVGNRQQNIPAASEKKWKYSLAGLGILFVLGAVAPGFYKAIYSEFVPMQMIGKKLANANPQVLSLLYDFYNDRVALDFMFAFGFLFVAFGALYRYLHQRLSLTVLGLVLIAVVVADLWRIDFQPMDPRTRIEQKDIFTAPDYVHYLKQDTTLFRVLLFENGQPPYDNKLAYWKIQSAYGYQGAKMRWFQDIDDVAGMGNPLVWQLMNVKYIISNTPDSSQVLSLVYNGPQYKVYANRAYVPRAFFVNRYEVATGIDMLRKMESMTFNVRDVSYFTDNPGISIEPPKEGAQAEYVHYGLQNIELNVTATGNNLLFLSESYYPKGWKAILDGNEIPIYRLNYLFRGVVVPAGTHKLEMVFEPSSFYTGKNVSLGMNVVLIAALLFAGYDYRKKRGAAVIPPAPQGENKNVASR